MAWRTAAPLVLVAWGALSFGAVYPWAYLPLFAGSLVVGTAGLLQRSRVGPPGMPLAGPLVLLAAAISLQLAPLPIDTLRRLSPGTDAILSHIVVGYPASVARHALSIDPGATVLGLGALIALAILFLGLSGALTRDDALNIARGVSLLGVVLALAGIVQKALWNGRIYGFWTPIEVGETFGPFVNRNHFAGWMLMAVPLALGYVAGRVARGMRQVAPGFRNRVIWFSSAAASETILIAFAVLTMALSLVLTMSRSGILGFVAALVITGWFVARRQATVSRRVLAAGYLVLVIGIALGWTGIDRIAARFSEREAGRSGGRLEIWADSWRLARTVPLAGSGLNTFGSAMLVHQTVDSRVHVGEAHNDYLQLLAEGGALVCVPAAILILGVAWTIRRRFGATSSDGSDYCIRVGAVTGILAIALQEAADFSLQMPGNAVFFVVVLAIAVRQPATERRVPFASERQ